MSYTLKILAPAGGDLRTIGLWYMSVRPELAADFLLSAEESAERVHRSPLSYPVIHKDIRRVIMHRFPYALLYRMKHNIINVIAVFHARRSPTVWQSRM